MQNSLKSRIDAGMDVTSTPSSIKLSPEERDDEETGTEVTPTGHNEKDEAKTLFELEKELGGIIEVDDGKQVNAQATSEGEEEKAGSV